jgi:hypothetical protein
MAIDRAAARKRVKTITAWSAGGAAVLTAAAAFAASKGDHVAAKAATPATGATQPPSAPDQGFVPENGYSQQPDPSQGFAPPSASTAPPAATSGGS